MEGKGCRERVGWVDGDDFLLSGDEGRGVETGAERLVFICSVFLFSFFFFFFFPS